jgi:Cyclic nucleotide-binding domain/Major Facilitator Superfamily
LIASVGRGGEGDCDGRRARVSVFRAIRSNRQLALLEASWAVVTFARWALMILVVLYAYRKGGAAAVGVVAMVRVIPSAFTAPRLALFADAHSRRDVLLISCAARGLLTVAMTVVVGVSGSLVLLVALAACFLVADGVQKPAMAALVSVWARNLRELAAANVAWSMIDYSGFLTGSLLVGFAVATIGLASAFAVCIAPFGLAGVLLAGMRRDAPELPLGVPGAPGDAAGAPAAGSELLAGVRTIFGHPEPRLLVGAFGVDMLVQAMVDVLIVIAAISLLDMGPQGAGWLSAAWGVGGLAGGLAAGSLLSRGRVAQGLSVGLLLVGVPLIAVAVFPRAPVALVLFVFLGVGFGLVEVALLTLTQRLVASDVLARVYGVQETLSVTATAVGSIGAAALVELFGVRWALLAAGAVLPGFVIALRRQIGALQAGTRVPEQVFELLRGLDLFAPLPMAAVETLAVRCRHESAEPGAEIIRHGDHGDTFFVIEAGDVAVLKHGVAQRIEAAGEYFGEIALMHDTPRTATVLANTAVRLLAIDRVDFLTAVGSHPRSQHHAQRIASERLSAQPG